jgi:hypothetical protein
VDWKDAAVAHMARELYVVEQEWRQVDLHLCGVGSVARRAIVVLRGRDTNERRGNFGPKFMAPQLRFLNPDEEVV